MLVVEDVSTYYGAIRALDGVSIKVDQGEMVAVIGANGAGKSTLLKTIAGVLGPRGGKVTLDGKAVTSPPYKAVAMGISLVPEGRQVFTNLTVDENLNMGAYLLRDKAAIEKTKQFALALFPRLKERQRQLAGTLSGGEQQMLALGRGLMAQPRLILLDEPSLGLAPKLVQQMFEAIIEINRAGQSVLLVEQNARMALTAAKRAYVLQTGRIVRTGTGADLLADPAIVESYLGVRRPKVVRA
ncbi:MAG: ABC transporter ATP-binding protein [Bacillota bacterium]